MTSTLSLSTLLVWLLAIAAPLRAATPGDTQQWVDEPAAFLSAQSGRCWVIGRSPVPSLSAQEATERACLDAATQIAPSLQTLLARRPNATWDRQRLRQQLASDLQVGRWVSDRYVSVKHKPYGDVWSAAVLVDGSAEALRPIADEYEAVARDRHRARFHQMGAIVGVCAGVLLLYAGVNAATKGYFRGRLRVAAALSLVALIVVFVRLIASPG